MRAHGNPQIAHRACLSSGPRRRVTSRRRPIMLADLLENPNPRADGGPTGSTAEASATVTDESRPEIVVEEEQLLGVVLRKLDGGAPRKPRVQVDDASTLI